MKKHPCTIDGIRYESESAASKVLGIEINRVRYRLRSSNFANYISKYHPKEGRKTFLPCNVAGIEYKSIGSAARELGISPGQMKRRLTSFDYPDYVCSKHPKKSPFKYEVRGKRYRTLQEIGDMEGLTKERIRQKMNNPKKPEYRKL